MKKTNRQLQKEQTKEMLVEAAYDLFAEKGIVNTRIADIAKAAGVSHGTVFVHFATQEALISEVIERYGAKIAWRGHQLADTSEDIRSLLEAHLAGIREYEQFYTRLVIENRLLPPAARDSWVAIQSAISFHFGQVAERERRAAGSPDIPSYMLFNMWVGLVHYYLMNADLFAPEGNVIERYGGVLIENYCKMALGIPECDLRKSPAR